MEGIKSINARIGYNDYEHVEFEGNGEAGTRFTTEAVEGRLELTHEEFGGFEGVAGIQVSNREFAAVGEEAFVEPVDTRTIGLFYVAQREFGELGLEAGVRYENVDHDPTQGASRSFDLGAVSLGLIQPLGGNWTLSGQFDFSSRAPVAEELYSNGPHLATNSFEIGDPDLDEEVATNVSANLTYEDERLSLYFSAFATEFSDFIYEFNTGLEEDELPVLQWTQQDASFRGFEVDASWEAVSWRNGSLALNAGFDAVRARLDSGVNRNVPRIPPQRFRLGATVTVNSLVAQLRWLEVDDQDDEGFGELPTEGYEDLRLNVSYGFDVSGSEFEVFFNGRNLTDDEQRYHTSFIKDFAPSPGRTVEAGIRIAL